MGCARYSEGQGRPYGSRVDFFCFVSSGCPGARIFGGWSVRSAESRQFGPLLPVCKVTGVTTVFPDTGLPQIPTQSKNSDGELKQTMIHTENARMLSVFYLNLLFSPCRRMLTRWWVVFKGKANLLWDPVRKCPYGQRSLSDGGVGRGGRRSAVGG